MFNDNERYWSILGLKPGSSKAEIQKAYIKKVKEYHPDNNPKDKDVRNKFKEIQEAYDVLYKGKRPNQEFNQQDFDFQQHDGRNFDFSDFFFDGGGFGSFQQDFNVQPQQISVNFSFEELLLKKNKTIQYYRSIKCKKCDGIGGFNYSFKDCSKCNGTGKIKTKGFLIIETVCPYCKGRKKKINRASNWKKCDNCNEYGYLNIKDQLEINCPYVDQIGQYYNMKNMGNYDVNSNDCADLHVLLGLQKHPDYQIQNNNIIYTIKISNMDLILGAEKKFKFLDGNDVTVNLESNIDVNQIYAFEQRGFMNSFGSRGKLYVKLNPQKTNLKKDTIEKIKKIINDQ